jgi:hypothetical protein
VSVDEVRRLRRANLDAYLLGERLVAGVVFYDGEAARPFGERLWALPLCALWSA